MRARIEGAAVSGGGGCRDLSRSGREVEVNGLDDDRRQILSLLFGWFASASHYRSVNLRTPGS